MNKKAQAMVEYVVILATISVSFVFIGKIFDKAIMDLFVRIGNFIANL